MEQTQAAGHKFKLDYKRTFIIGFAFFGILLLWQVYDSWCPVFLEKMFMDKMGATSEEVSYLVGIMMAIDNLAALILMPIFGRLSDKTHTKLGKRMPYILVGVNAKVDSLCVLSGESSLEDVKKYEHQPTFILDSIKDLPDLLEK